MGKLIGGIFIGLIAGAAITFYFFVGVPSASQLPGAPILPPDPGVSAGTAQIVLRQEFFNQLLLTIFRDMKRPAFPLIAESAPVGSSPGGYQYAAFQEPLACDGNITILPEGSGVQTGLRLDNNRIAAPLAFSGNYNSPFGCLQFTGWAQANLELRFDSAGQTVFGHINVETVNLDGVNPIVNRFVTPLVQSTLNTRVNPIQILQVKQIAIDIPVKSTGGKLQAGVKDVRAEVKDSAVNLYVIYEFSGAPIP